MKRYSIVQVIWSLMLLGAATAQSDLVVHTDKGKIRGTTFQSIRSNKTIFGFLGIPYATPPLRDLRFKDPLPIEPWQDTLNATKEGSACVQQVLDVISGDENCLYLNVYSPQLPENSETELIPVMVWIHGGFFVGGSGSKEKFGPDYITDEDVVLVTLNYRLGLFGFLNLQIPDAPGNVGLKDQVLALKWVQKNIAQFGGDPKQVTIFGESAGAVSVHLHLLSPMSRGLFQGAIAQSGSAFVPWGFQTEESRDAIESKLMGIVLLEDKRLDALKKEKLLEILKQLDTATVVRYNNHLKEDFQFVFRTVVTRTTPIKVSVGPTIDTASPNDEVFLPDTPMNMVTSGNIAPIPYITGTNSAEALMAMGSLIDLLQPVKQLHWDIKAATSLLLEVIRPETSLILRTYTGRLTNPILVEEVLFKYFGTIFDQHNDVITKFVNLLTDLYFTNGVACAATMQVAHTNAPVYSYELVFNSSYTIGKQYYHVESLPGVAHKDDLMYLFPQPNETATQDPNSSEYKISKRMVKMWTNFAKTGNPTPESDPLLQFFKWNPVTPNSYPYMNIDVNLTEKHDLNNGALKFWNTMFGKYFITMRGLTPCIIH